MRLPAVFADCTPGSSLVVAATLVLMLAVVAVMLQREAAAQQEVVGVSRDSMRTLVSDRLRMHGEALASQLAESLTNPLYYFDLDAIGDDHPQRHAPAGRRLRASCTTPRATSSRTAPATSRRTARRCTTRSRTRRFRRKGCTRSGAIATSMSPARSSVGDQRLGGVRVGYSLASIRNDESRATQALRHAPARDRAPATCSGSLVLLAMLVALGGLASLVLQRALVRPIRQLAAVAHEFESGNYDADVPESHRNDEIGDLMRAFGRMGTQRRAPRPRHPPHGLHRCADRPGQPAGLPRAPRPAAAAAARRRAATGAAVRRHRRLQARQRHARPRRRRRSAGALRQPHPRRRRTHGSACDAGALRRRRVRDPAGSRRPARRATCARSPAGWPIRWSRNSRGPIAVQDRQVFLGTSDRHHPVPGRRDRRDHADEERRHRDVPGEGRRQELLSLLQPRDGPGGRAPRAHGAGPARRVGARRAQPGLPADPAPGRQAPASAPRRCCAGSIRSRA